MILGIDPGLNGALAYYDRVADTLTVHDMPTYEITTNGKKRRVLDEANLVKLMRHAEMFMCETVIENVHSMPKQGVASSFKFGMVFGTLRGIISTMGVPVRYVEPRIWKHHFGLTADKDATRRYASQILPQHAHQWPLKKHDGRAEAALLAFYGYRLFSE